MSVGIIITGVFISLAGIISTILALYRYHSIKKLMTNSAITIGEVEFIKNVRNSNGDYSYYWLNYIANGKDYSHKILTRSGKYDDNSNVSIVYLPDNPNIAYCKCEFEKIRLESLRSLIVALVLTFVVAIMLLVLYAYDARTIIDALFGSILCATSWAWYIDERNRLYKGKATVGTIVYSAANKHTCRVVARYSIDGYTYETRQMIAPLRAKTKYNINDQIGIKYREKHPNSAIIEEDKMQLLFAKTAVILFSIGVVFYMILCFLDR